MRQFLPGVGRVIERPRTAGESAAAAAARRERMAFYSSRLWRAVARRFLAANPTCCWCGRLATMVDHRLPRLERPDLAYDPLNLRACCRRCHAMHGARA